MTVAEMRVEILDQLQEFYTDNNRIQPADVLRVLNRFYVEVARKALCFSRTASMSTVDNIEGYDRPLDMVKVRSVRHSTTLLQATTVDYLDAMNTGWRDATKGVPTHFFVRDTQKIGLYPKPTGVVSLYVEGWVIPSTVSGGIALLSADANEPGFPAEYHMLLVYGSVFLLGTRKLLDNQAAQSRAMAAKADYDVLLRDFDGYNRHSISLRAPVGSLADSGTVGGGDAR